jgi:2-(1,2-epoxy-1,2-dihydrophenyl)acetyl-CoA isomerase
MPYKTLLLEVRDNVAHLTLNRPEAMNTIDLEMGAELMEAAIECESNAAVRAVLLTGAGKVFCAGGDLRGMQAQGERADAYNLELTTYLHTAIMHFTRMDAPVIAAVNGTTAGAGVGLVAMADLAVAAAGAKFTAAYTAVGLTPDGSTTFFLPRLAGSKRAAELLLLNRTLSAAEALDWGLINQVVPDGMAVEEAGKIAARLAAGPKHAHGQVKRLLAASAGALEAQLAVEGRTISVQVKSAEAREGIAAFLEKRKANFRA